MSTPKVTSKELTSVIQPWGLQNTLLHVHTVHFKSRLFKRCTININKDLQCEWLEQSLPSISSAMTF